MKFISCILLLLILSSCNVEETNTKQHDNDRIVFVPEPDKDLREKYEKADAEKNIKHDTDTCLKYHADLLNLKKKELQTEFFVMLDSIKNVQYPSNDQDSCNSVDLSPDLLKQFLNDIDIDSLKSSNLYTALYNFNIACHGFKDSDRCMDKISFQFFPETCGYRIVIENSYLVEGACIGGSQVNYGFKIKGDRIVNLSRQEAG